MFRGPGYFDIDAQISRKFRYKERHLALHQVMPTEFEEVLKSDPLDLDYELIDSEERYRAVGLTSGFRLLSVVFTVHNGKIRGITAFPAGVQDEKAFLDRPR